MSNYLNPKPRFGYDPHREVVYDYLAQRDVSPSDEPYESLDGVWDLNEVKAAILTGHTIEGALIDRVRPKPAARPQPPLPNAGTVKAPAKAPPKTDAKTPPADGDDAPPPGPAQGLSVAQLLSLRLSAIQCAALGITPTQLNATGVTAQQVEGWGLTPERAEALKLTPPQRAILLP